MRLFLLRYHLKSTTHPCVSRGVFNPLQEVPDSASHSTHAKGTTHIVQNSVGARLLSMLDAGSLGTLIRRLHRLSACALVYL